MNQNVKDPKVTKQAYFLQSIPCVSGGIISVQTIKKCINPFTSDCPRLYHGTRCNWHSPSQHGLNTIVHGGNTELSNGM